MRKNNWRLIISSPNTGPWNMAVDEAVMESVAAQDQPPTLRLYAWWPYCLSLGHAQSIKEVDQECLRHSGWDIVRRPTGGRAILHADELTYSICALFNDPLIGGGVIESYRTISAGLLRALEMLGLAADSKPKNQGEKHLSRDPVCFQYPSDYEITFGGKKLIGSAQARRMNTLLQHGAIPLFGDITRIISALVFESERKKDAARHKLLLRASTLEDVIGRRVSWQEMADTIVLAFEELFHIRFAQKTLSTREFTRAKELITTKYDHADWTERI